MEKRKFIKSILLGLGIAVGRGVKAQTGLGLDNMGPLASASPSASPSTSV